MGYGNQIVSPALLEGLVGGSAAVPHRPRRVLLLLEFYVVAGFRTDVPLRQTEIDDVQGIRFFTGANQKVLRFDVPVNVVLGMETLRSGYHLVGEMGESRCLEFEIAKFE